MDVVKGQAVFKGYVLDPVSNHIGICLSQLHSNNAPAQHQPQKTLLQHIQNKIKIAARQPWDKTMYVQISEKCFTEWADLRFGRRVDVVLQRPSVYKSAALLGINRSLFPRYTPWTLVQISNKKI